MQSITFGLERKLDSIIGRISDRLSQDACSVPILFLWSFLISLSWLIKDIFMWISFALLYMDCPWTSEMIANVGSLLTSIYNSRSPSLCLQGQVFSPDSRWNDGIGVHYDLSEHWHAGMGTVLGQASAGMRWTLWSVSARSFLNFDGILYLFFFRIDTLMMVSWPQSYQSIKSRAEMDMADQKDRNLRIKYQIQSCVEFLDVVIQNDNGQLTTSVFHKPTAEPYILPLHIRPSTSCSLLYSICRLATSCSNLLQCARLHYRTHSNWYVSAIERLSISVHHQACQSIRRPIQCSIGVKTAEWTTLV